MIDPMMLQSKSCTKTERQHSSPNHDEPTLSYKPTRIAIMKYTQLREILQTFTFSTLDQMDVACVLRVRRFL